MDIIVGKSNRNSSVTTGSSSGNNCVRILPPTYNSTVDMEVVVRCCIVPFWEEVGSTSSELAGAPSGSRSAHS